jgi:hypothetical protein
VIDLLDQRIALIDKHGEARPADDRPQGPHGWTHGDLQYFPARKATANEPIEHRPEPLSSSPIISVSSSILRTTHSIRHDWLLVE